MIKKEKNPNYCSISLMLVETELVFFSLESISLTLVETEFSFNHMSSLLAIRSGSVSPGGCNRKQCRNRIAARDGFHTPVASQVFPLIKGLWRWRQQRWHVSYTLALRFVFPRPPISVKHLQFLSSKTFVTTNGSLLLTFFSNVVMIRIFIINRSDITLLNTFVP